MNLLYKTLTVFVLLIGITCGQVEPIPLTTGWQEQIQAQLNLAGIKAAFRNKNVTVTVPEGEYEFVSLRIPPNVSFIADPNVIKSVRLRYIGGDDATLITVGSGYGTTVSGFEIRSKTERRKLVGLRFDRSVNAELSRTRFDFYGYEDCVGFEIGGRESIVVEKVEARCTIPFRYLWGDNCVIRDFDAGSATTMEQKMAMNHELPSTVIHLLSVPNQLIFEGYQTWQGAERAMLGKSTSDVGGQLLIVRNMRYEQSLSTQNSDIPAFDFSFRKPLEMFVLDGCRHTTRLFAMKLYGVWNMEKAGSVVPGKVVYQ